MALSYVYAAYGNVPLIAALFFGLKAAVLAIVLEAVVRVGKRALKNNVMVALAAAAFVGIFFFDVPFPIIIFGAALIGFVGARSGCSAFQVQRRPRQRQAGQRASSTACSATTLPDACAAERSRARCASRRSGWRSGWCR